MTDDKENPEYTEQLSHACASSAESLSEWLEKHPDKFYFARHDIALALLSLSYCLRLCTKDPD